MSKIHNQLRLDSRPLNIAFCAWTKLDAFSTIIYLPKDITLFWVIISYGLQSTSQHFILLEYREEGQHNYVYLINDTQKELCHSQIPLSYSWIIDLFTKDWTLQILLKNNYTVSMNRFSQSRKTGLLTLSRHLPCHLCSVIEIS